MSKSLLQREMKKTYFGSDPAADVHEHTPEQPAGKTDSPETAPIASSHREHDTGIGRRKPEKHVASPDELKPPLPPEPISDQDNREINELLKNDTALPWLGKTLRAILLLTASVAMFFIITQTASFLATVRQLTYTEQILLSVPLAIFGGIILGYLLKMLLLFWKLRVSPQIRPKALQALEERKALRDLSLKANRQAVGMLCCLLEDKNTYASKDYQKTLRKLAVPPETIAALERARTRLIENAKNPSATSNDWLNDFRRDFQSPLDKIAGERIRKHYMHAGIMTGISPYPLIDRLIVLRTCLSMLKELLEIYALKPSWDKNLALLAQVILDTYLAGVIDNAAENGMNMVMDNIPELTNATLSRGMDLVIRKGGGKGAGMLAQAYLVYRLGNDAVKVLQPISIKAGN